MILAYNYVIFQKSVILRISIFACKTLYLLDFRDLSGSGSINNCNNYNITPVIINNHNNMSSININIYNITPTINNIYPNIANINSKTINPNNNSIISTINNSDTNTDSISCTNNNSPTNSETTICNTNTSETSFTSITSCTSATSDPPLIGGPHLYIVVRTTKWYSPLGGANHH